jgi:DNA-binding MarR family transcriptional regulator
MPFAREWLLDDLSRREGHWLVVDEHLVGTRIPDLLAARVDLRVLRARVRAEQWEALNSSELRLLALLREDRSVSVRSAANRLGYTHPTTRRLLRRLEHLGYAGQDRASSFRRIRSRYRIFTRLIAVEAKLRDWRRALVQARSHRSFAQESFVVFDAAYADRFNRAKPHFMSSGTGLIAVDTEGNVERLIRARGSRKVDAAAFALAGEELWLRLQGVTRPLPQTRLPSGAALIARPGRRDSPESRSRSLSRLLDALAESQPGRQH